MFQFMEELRNEIIKRENKSELMQADISQLREDINAAKNEIALKEKQYTQTLDDAILIDINTLKNTVEELQKDYDIKFGSLRLLKGYKLTVDSETLNADINTAIQEKQLVEKRNQLLVTAQSFREQLAQYSELIDEFLSVAGHIKTQDAYIDRENMLLIIRALHGAFINLNFTIEDKALLTADFVESINYKIARMTTL